jgi:cell division protein FtsB
VTWILGSGLVAALGVIAWLAYQVIAAAPAIRAADAATKAQAGELLKAQAQINTLANERDQLKASVAKLDAERVKAVGAYEACVMSLDAVSSRDADAHVKTIRGALTDADAVAALRGIVSTALPQVPAPAGALVVPSAPAGGDSAPAGSATVQPADVADRRHS